MLEWTLPVNKDGEEITRAVWWADGEFHAVFRDGVVVGVVANGSTCCLQKEGETKRYVTGLCSVVEDMEYVGTTLRMRNVFSDRPYLCRPLLPTGTTLMKHTGEEEFSPSISWAGCETAEGSVSTSDQCVQLAVHPNGASFTVSYPAKVRVPTTDPQSLKHSADNPLRYGSITETEHLYTLHTQIHPTDTVPLHWACPLSLITAIDCPTHDLTSTLPISEPLLGDGTIAGYPLLAPTGYTAANLFRSLSTTHRPIRLVFERSASCVFWPDKALVLHDMSVVSNKGGYYTHTLESGERELHTNDRRVRLDVPSPLTSEGQYFLRDIVSYISSAEPVRDLDTKPKLQVPLAEKRCSIPDVGEACILGDRLSLRFLDRCVIRMRVDNPFATLLLPNGESMEVRLDNPSIPPNVREYCGTAVRVYEQLLGPS